MEGVSSPEVFSIIKPTIEQTPFNDPTMQTFFVKLCEVNDSIDPQYLSREEWNERKKGGLLQKDRDDGKSTLLIPRDLKLWEMVAVAEAMDTDTFAHKPEKQRKRTQEMRELGADFINTGIYLAKNIDLVDKGRTIAIATAQDFYRYGNALQTGDYEQRVSIDEIADNALSDSQTDEIDTWFGVDRLDHFKHPDHDRDDVGLRDQTRKEMFGQFFKVADAAEKGSEPHQRAIKNVKNRYIENVVRRPFQEMEGSVIARGIEKVAVDLGRDGWRDEQVRQDFLAIGIDLEGTERTLSNVLEIPRLRTELALLRETGDVQQISQKEQEIAAEIHKAVSTLPPPEDENVDFGSMPAKIIENQYRNCVGATMIGGALLEEAGIQYLVGDMPKHSMMLLVTSDDCVHLLDMQHTEIKRELTDDDIEDPINGEIPITIRDIVDYTYNPSSNGLQLNIQSFVEALYKPYVSEEFLEYNKRDIKVYTPDKGMQIHILSNLGSLLHKDEEYETATIAYQEGLRVDKENIHLNNRLANNFFLTKRYEECIATCNFVLDRVPNNILAYYIRGDALTDQGFYEKAIEDLTHGMSLDPSTSKSKASAYYTLGKAYFLLKEYDQAASAFTESISLSYGNLGEAYANIGVSYKKLGENAKALEAFAKAIELTDDDQAMIENIQRNIDDINNPVEE
ncbi:MAG: tetratricopeptide repeat protein [Candidatus Levyibacteriota bacterium]